MRGAGGPSSRSPEGSFVVQRDLNLVFRKGQGNFFTYLTYRAKTWKCIGPHNRLCELQAARKAGHSNLLMDDEHPERASAASRVFHPAADAYRA